LLFLQKRRRRRKRRKRRGKIIYYPGREVGRRGRREEEEDEEDKKRMGEKRYHPIYGGNKAAMREETRPSKSTGAFGSIILEKLLVLMPSLN
jgi:hypothetical protein